MSYQDALYIKLSQSTEALVNQMPGFATKFFRQMRHKNMSPRTLNQYAYDMLRFFDFLKNSSAGFDDLDYRTCSAADMLDRLNSDDIGEYIDTLETYSMQDKNGQIVQKRSSEAVIARRISSLRSFYKYYYKIGDIKNDLAALIELPKMHNKEIITMDQEDVARLLAAVEDMDGLSAGQKKRHAKVIKRDKAILTLLLGTGIRVSELVGIDINDIDYYNDSIIVTRKGGDQDEVFFGDAVEDALLEYDDECRDILLAGNENEMAYFVSMKHQRLSVAMVEKMIKGYAQKAGLNIKVTPHSCRRSFGTEVYNKTGDIYLTAAALNHSSVEVTIKHYAKPAEEKKRAAAKAVKDLFNSPK